MAEGLLKESDGRLKAHIVALLVVGGVLLFAFFVYLVGATFAWIFTHPHVLVYAFIAVATVQAYWLFFAFLKRRFRSQNTEM
ncbi:MAG: hypothetical protein AUK47_03145 [Deltaproteobacteria bacterium CG2_30_63_29]|nr:MAG: hypothetical protein AUK47_03145 [Deltaproteobacteria bacterium CG2_30_63_29]PJB35870.1 MAG: hypothetical protein CO108_24655 [Deltaproteobacteria bacterium CG_4_9_14_3_um_filter_63_12]